MKKSKKKNAAKPSRGTAVAELEVKIDVDSLETIAVLRAHFLGVAKEQGAELHKKRHPRRYFDTPDLDLHRLGISVRLQKEPDGRYKQVVKYELASDRPLGKGEVLRVECADIVPGPKPDLSRVTDPEARRLLSPFLKEKMVYIGKAAFKRDYFNLTRGDGTVELAFDIGHFKVGGRKAPCPRFKIEIEQVAGSPEALQGVLHEIFEIAGAGKASVDPFRSKSDELTSLHLEARRKGPG